MEDPLVYEPKQKSAFGVHDAGVHSRAPAPAQGSRLLVGLLVLNLIVSSTLLVGFFVSVFQVKAEVKSIRDSSTPLAQLGKLWHTNTDLSTWKEAMTTVSKLADQVKDIDWKAHESYIIHTERDCNDLYGESCEAFVGDDGKKCKWDEDANHCTGSAHQMAYPETIDMVIESSGSKKAQDFFAGLKKWMDDLASKLPSTDDKEKQAASGETSQVCASTPAPIVVKEESVLDMPVLADTMAKDAPCFAHKSEDLLNSATKDIVSSIVIQLGKYDFVCGPIGQTYETYEQCIQDQIGKIMAFRNFFLQLVSKYTSVVDAKK